MDDISIADHIHGEETPILQGKSRRKKQTVHSKTEKNFTSSNIIETQKPTSIHGKFKPKWQDRRNQFPPGKITDIKRSNIISQST